MPPYPGEMRGVSWPRFPNVEKALNDCLAAVRSYRPISSPSVRANVTPSGTSYEAVIPHIKPYRPSLYLYDYAGGTLAMTPGTIIWHDRSFDITMDPMDLDSNLTDEPVYIDLVDEFDPDDTAEGFGVNSGAWGGYPDQPNSPARRYLLLGLVSTDSNSNVTNITRKWEGGTIIWPGPFGFWA